MFTEDNYEILKKHFLVLFIVVSCCFSIVLFQNITKKQEAKTLFLEKCSRCHGEHGEKVAFGRTRIIRDMKHDEFLLAINGYKNKTYGGQLKYFMAHFVEKLEEEQIELIINYLEHPTHTFPV